MSVEAIAIALHHSRAKSSTSKLVLLGIANHDGDGGAWPSVATLAGYAMCSTRTVQRAVDELERLGEIRRVVQGGGLRHTADHRRPNLYEVLLRCPSDCDRSKSHRTRRQPGPMVELEGLDPLEPVESAPELSTRVTPMSPHRVTPMSPEPSLEPSTTETSVEPLQTARVREAWDHVCIDGTMQHAISRKTHACAYCGARRLHWQET